MKTITELKKEIEAFKDAIINYPYKPQDRKLDVDALIESVVEKNLQEVCKEIEKCKIHTMGVLMLIDKEELLKKFGGKE